MKFFIYLAILAVIIIAGPLVLSDQAHGYGHSGSCVTKTEYKQITPSMPRWKARQILDGPGEFIDSRHDVCRVCGHSKYERNIIFKFNLRHTLTKKRLYRWQGSFTPF